MKEKVIKMSLLFFFGILVGNFIHKFQEEQSQKQNNIDKVIAKNPTFSEPTLSKSTPSEPSLSEKTPSKLANGDLSTSVSPKDICELVGSEEPYHIKKNGLITEKGLTFDQALVIIKRFHSEKFCHLPPESCELVGMAASYSILRNQHPLLGGLDFKKGNKTLQDLKKLRICQ